MKNSIKYILQQLLGYHGYLYLFARFMVLNLPHDKQERDFMHLLTYLKKHDTVVDVGANIGVMTYHLARRVSQGKVFAIEPIASNRRVINRLVRRFDLANVVLLPIAVGDENGKCKMTIPQKRGVSLHGLAHVVAADEFNAAKGEEVQMKRLDDLPELKLHRIAAIKLDVEESEYAALKGAEQLLIVQKPVVYCELWNTKNRRLTFDFMQSLGYEAHMYNGTHLQPAKINCAKQNFFFLPKQTM